MKIISNYRLSAWLLAVIAPLLTAYLAAFIEQSTNKGWRSRDAEETAHALASHLASSGSPIKVNIAQQYTDGCSFALFEIYRRNCFAIHLSAPLSTNPSSIDLEGYVKIAEEILSSKGQQPQAGTGGRAKNHAKITLVVEGFQTSLEPDGTRRTFRKEIKRITFEEQ